MPLGGVNWNVDNTWSFITEYRKHRRRNRSRFSLLLLEHGEYYFNDYSVDFFPPSSPMRLPAGKGHLACSSTNQGGAAGMVSKRRAQRGRLKLCSRGLLFEPADEHEPCLRFRYSDMVARLGNSVDGENGSVHQREKDSERWRRKISSFCESSSSSSTKIILVDSTDMFSFCINTVVEIDGGERPAPYRVIKLGDDLEPNMKTFSIQLHHTDIANLIDNEIFGKKKNPLYLINSNHLLDTLWQCCRLSVNFLPLLCFLLDTAMEVKVKGISQEAPLLHSLLTVRFGSCLSRFNAVHLVDLREVLQFPHPLRVERVIPLLKVPGGMMLTDYRIYFQPAEVNNVDTRMLSVELSSISRVSKRCHLLQQTGLELVGKGGNGDTIVLTLAFISEAERNAVYVNIINQAHGWRLPYYPEPPLHRVRRRVSKNVLEHADLRKALLRWQRKELSNYEYLCHLNAASGRSINDLSRYPVFPWVINDYTSRTLDLSSPSTYRDLSKPVGALNKERLDYFKARMASFPSFENCNEGMTPPFLYGTHFSTPGYVLFYLVRSAPENGRYDSADRLFYSVKKAWESVQTNYTDLKELIPEFYAGDGSFLFNSADLDLGVCQGGECVGDVELPPWANGSPKSFIQGCHNALEGEYVSERLHQWIDLIFGSKQTGQASLEGAVDMTANRSLEEQNALEVQISEFGQCPKQLFVTSHPSRGAIDSPVELAEDNRSPQSPYRQEPLSHFNSPPLFLGLQSTTSPSSTPSERLRCGPEGELPPHQQQQQQQQPDSSPDATLSTSTAAILDPELVDSRSPKLGFGTLLKKGFALTQKTLVGSSSTKGPFSSGTGSRGSLRSEPYSVITPQQRKVQVVKLNRSEANSGSEGSTEAAVVLSTTQSNSLHTRRHPIAPPSPHELQDTTYRGCLLESMRNAAILVQRDEISGEVTAVTKRCFSRYDSEALFQLPNAHDDGVSVMELHEDIEGGIRTSPGLLVTGGWDAAVRLWKVTSSGVIVKPPEVEWFDLDTPVMAVTIDSTGNIVAAVSEGGQLGVWNTRTGETITSSQVVQKGPIVGLKWGIHANKTCLAIASGNGVVSKLTLMGRLLSSMVVTTISKSDDAKKQQSSIVSFDSDGKTSFVGCTDGSITVLQHCDTPEKGFEQVMSIQAFDLPSKISCLQVSSDGSTLLCGSTKGILKIWAVIKNEDI